MKVATRATAAETLAGFGADLRWEGLPEAVRSRVPELVLDLFGVALRGSREPSSRAVLEAVRGAGGDGARVLGGGLATDAAWAALANGASGHALEMDDVTNESSLHPGVAVIPAALALAQETGAQPVRFLEAVVCGYEIAIRAGNALNAASAYRRGFHPTGVAGAFGAAAAGAKVLGLDAERTAQALGIAGTMASGSLEYLSDGSWTKRITAGWAAHAGVVAARLARAGVSGPRTVFEGPRGFLRQFSDDPAPERLLTALGDPLMVMTVSLKPYACCRYNHGLIDCALELRDRVRVDEIARLRLGVLDAGALLVARPIERKRDPRNVVDAQFSAPFAVAIALASGAAGAAQYTDEALADPPVRELMRRTDCVGDAALDARYPREWGAWVELVLRDGRTLRAEVDDPLGGPAHPLSREALVARFRDLTGLGDDVARRVLGLADERDLSFVV